MRSDSREPGGGAPGRVCGDARALGHRADELAEAEGRRILCVGDSHTYGTSVPRAESYPAQLEAYLNRVDPEGRYRVVNRGLPGMNSAQLAGLLPRWLGQSDPEFVVVWIGANNWWNRAQDPMAAASGAGGGLRRLLAGSRLLRLVQTLRIDAAWRDSLGDADALGTRIFEQNQPWFGGKAARSEAEFIDVTLEDLRQIELALGRSRVDWLLVTYPQTHPSMAFPKSAQELHARAVQRFERGRSIPVVDTALDLSRARASNPKATLVCVPSTLREGPCLFVNEMGPHPTGLLYGFIAESIGGALLERLGCAGACALERKADRRREGPLADPAPGRPASSSTRRWRNSTPVRRPHAGMRSSTPWARRASSSVSGIGAMP